MKTSKLRVTGLCVGNSPMTGEFPAQMASNAENVSIWWRHRGQRLWQTTAELILISHIGGLVQDGTIFIANSLEILQSCTDPSIYWTEFWMHPKVVGIQMLWDADQQFDVCVGDIWKK